MAFETSVHELRNGNLNKLMPHDRAAHEWYRFVLSFPPHLVRQYLERFEIEPSSSVLDPFCGTGTTLVECKKRGIPSLGIEAHPMAYFASHVKTAWRISPEGLFRHARTVADRTTRRLRSEGFEDGLLTPRKRPQNQTLRGLSPDVDRLLLRGSISPVPLHKVLVLLEEIQYEGESPFCDHERLALAKALVHYISNLEFGPEVGVGPPRSDAQVVMAWLDCVSAMVDDLRELREIDNAPAKTLKADSRSIDGVLSPGSVDAVITSPPYPNEKDYTRTTRLESVLLGFIRNKEELRAVKRGLIRSNTRNVYVGDADDSWVTNFSRIQQIAAAIEARREELGKTSGFERLYARVTKLYFGGMARHLKNLQRVLRPGAMLAYVVGDQASYLRVRIPTGQILAEIAQSLGYRCIAVDLFRTRLSTATREQLREEVVVLQWGKRR
jgi:DNA modification methylase